MNRSFILLLTALILGAVAASVIVYHRERVEHSRLAAQLTAIRLQVDAAERIRAENARMKEVVELSRRDRGQAAAAVHADVDRARREVAELERKAVADRAAILEENRGKIAALQANRDLAKGAVLVENCADVGRATPEAALQTLVWASAHGHDDIVRGAVTYDSAARALAEAAIATLPESVRTKYPNPEALAALFVAQVVNDLSAIRVVDRSMEGAQATLTIAGVQKQLGKVGLTQTSAGWQVVIDTAGFERIRRLLLTPKK